MNEFELPPVEDTSVWGLTNDKIARMIGDDPRTAANSIMPGILSQKGFENTVWGGAVTDMIERNQLPRRPIVKEGQYNPPYVNRFPIYENELLELMTLSGVPSEGGTKQLASKVRGNPELEHLLWTTKSQRDIEDCRGKYSGSCAQQLGVLADKWDVDARHLKTYYRTRGGMLT